MTDDPYEVLQVSHNAEAEVIEAAYRRLARKYHPDVDRSPTATARMQQINRAYEILRDPIQRARWDRASRARHKPPPYHPPPPPPPGPPSRRPTQPPPRSEAYPPRDDSSTPTPSPTPSAYTRSFPAVLIASAFLGAYYACALSFYIGLPNVVPILLWLGIAFGIFASLLLSIAAAAGWDPSRIALWRIVLMFPLTLFPVVAWIPCYLAGTAVARKVARPSPSRQSRWPIVIFGFGAIALNFVVFGGPNPTPIHTGLSDDCLASNPVLSQWLRETTPADTVALTALQAASDLYANPSDTARIQALDWQRRTTEAYDFMVTYTAVPECLRTYHDSVTDTLLKLSLGFSELTLVYVSMDSDQEYQSHLRAAGDHFADAIQSSNASTTEWDRLEALGFGPGP